MSTAALPVSAAVAAPGAATLATAAATEAAGASLAFDFAALVQGLALPLAATETLSESSAEALPTPPDEGPAEALAALLAGLGGLAAPTPPSSGVVTAPPATNADKPALASLPGAAASAAAAKAGTSSPDSASAAAALAADTAGTLRAEAEMRAPAKLADAEFAAADTAQNPTQGLLAPVGQARAATSAQVLAHVQAPVSSPGWAQELAQRVVWLTRNDAQSAQITLNPAHLGPIEIRLNLVADQATAVFVSPHGDVREALEAALPRLREMFAGAGIELGQAQVNSQSQRQSGSEGEATAQPGPGAGAPVGAVLADNEPGTSLRALSRGLVDTFA